MVDSARGSNTSYYESKSYSRAAMRRMMQAEQEAQGPHKNWSVARRGLYPNWNVLYFFRGTAPTSSLPEIIPRNGTHLPMKSPMSSLSLSFSLLHPDAHADQHQLMIKICWLVVKTQSLEMEFYGILRLEFYVGILRWNSTTECGILWACREWNLRATISLPRTPIGRAPVF